MKLKIAFLIGFLTCINVTIGQNAFSQAFGEDGIPITTAVPFITITPDARAGAMGEVGVATSADIHSLHWNPSKLAFLDKKTGFAVSYTPWLADLVPDISLAYLTGYSRINDNSAWSAALRYFSMGTITFTDDSGVNYGDFEPNEYTFDLGYGMRFNNNFSGGIAMRYIYSNLTGGQNVAGYHTEAGKAFSVDLSTYYQSDPVENNQWAVGMNISNIGTKISYTENEEEDFLPTTLKIGGRYSRILDQYNTFSISMDINKMLVPSPPIYDGVDSDGNDIIVAGEDPNVSVIQGIFQSFGDSPEGLKGEWRELMYCIGFEYWYNNQFAFRAGHFNEHSTEGNRKYFTLGAGLRMNVFELDFAYLVTANPEGRSPLENTVRFTLGFDLGAFGNNNAERVNTQ